MVEGPGCTLKGEKLGPRAKGQVVKGVLGNAVDRHTKKKKKQKPSGEDPSPVPPPANEISPYHVLLGHASTEVLTLGKELFMFFEGVHVCLRIHFLMAGGFRVNGQKLDTEGGGEAQTPSLVLRMSKDVITFNKCSAEMRPAEESRSRVMANRHLDIVSSHFHHTRAVQTLGAQDGERMMCDLLLDQKLLPGVGNIIKNEALFDSGIKPDTKLSALNEAQLSFLVKMTRDFTMIFYKCRKEGKPLQPYMKIYRKGKCGQCGSKNVTTRLGVDAGRLTTYCPVCQGEGTAKTGKLPTKNSLLGWVTSSSSPCPPVPEWACSACTFLNKASSKSCSICLTPAPQITQSSSPGLTKESTSSPGLTKESTKGGSQGTESISRDILTSTNLNGKLVQPRMPVRSSPRRAALLTSKRKSAKMDLGGSKKVCVEPRFPSLNEHWRGQVSLTGRPVSQSIGQVSNNFTQGSPGVGRASPGVGRASPGVGRASPGVGRASPGIGRASPGVGRAAPSVGRAAPGVGRAAPSVGRASPGVGRASPSVGRASPGVGHANAPNASQVNGKPSSTISQASQAPAAGTAKVINQACPTHKARCMIREVRKENQNKQRMFFCCPTRNCNFFLWADESFPHCEAHGKRCVLRTVLKDGPNNGRRFFACPQPKKKQCKTFHWADQYNEFTIR